MKQAFSYFDGHCDTISRGEQTGERLLQNSGHVDLVRGGEFAAYAQIFALFFDAGNAPGTLFPIAKRLHARLMQEVSANHDRITFCRTAAEVCCAAKAGKIAALLGIEGAELLDCRIENIPIAAAWGTRYLTLTWNYANAISGSNQQCVHCGLSDYGRRFVRGLYRCGILPDVSHLSDAGFWDLVSMELGPVIASHSNSRAICDHPRNLTDDMFSAIVQTGGVVGINFFQEFVGGAEQGFASLLRHVDHFLDLGGENALCLGGDLDGCDHLCGGMQGLQSIPTLYDAFRTHGYDAPLLNKLFYENWLRML